VQPVRPGLAASPRLWRLRAAARGVGTAPTVRARTRSGGARAAHGPPGGAAAGVAAMPPAPVLTPRRIQQSGPAGDGEPAACCPRWAARHAVASRAAGARAALAPCEPRLARHPQTGHASAGPSQGLAPEDVEDTDRPASLGAAHVPAAPDAQG